MHKGIKALVKHELKTTLYMGSYFMLVVLGVIYWGACTYNQAYTQYINEGVYSIKILQSIQVPMDLFKVVLAFFAVGILIIVISMFREQRHSEVSRFLKSLPCSQYYYGVKGLMGFLSYTIPYIVLVIGYIILRKEFIYFFNDIQSISYIGAIQQQTDTLYYLIELCLLNYLILTAWYTFLLMMQYMWNHTIGAAFVGILFWSFPSYVCSKLLYRVIANIRLGKIMNYLQPFLYATQEELKPRNYDYIYENQVNIILDASTKMIILLVLIAVSVSMIVYLNQKVRVEDSHILVPFKIVRIVFILTVALYVACIASRMGFALFMYSLGVGRGVYYLFIISGAVVGGLVGYKISYKGIERRK